MGAESACGCQMSRRRLLGTAGATGAVVAGAGGCVRAENRPEPQDAVRGRVIAQTTEVPVGGGVVLVDSKLVLTQPEKNEFRAYTAVCTHTGCTIQEVHEDIHCLCHGSRFDIATGSVVQGPASEPLKRFDVTVDGTDITLDA